MEERMKLLFLIKIATFILLSCKSNFTSDLSKFKKYIDENCNVIRKLDVRTYRLLTNYKQDKNSCNKVLKETTLYNVENEKKYIYNNEKGDKGKNRKSYGCSLSNEGNHKLDMKNKFCIFETKKYSYLEKKIFKELDYENFLKNNHIISDKLYKRIILKKYGLQIAIPLLLFLILSISLILDLFVGYGLVNMLKNILKNLVGVDYYNTIAQNFYNAVGPLANFFKAFFVIYIADESRTVKKLHTASGLFGILIYFLPFVILGVTIISGIIYYHKKVKKFEKIKFRKR
ncbi:hypothetical protein MKS88_001040 [Plasmodium brasilianum]|uniref:Fam-l protein n=2 Tax=Plasmodium (Plasmodium) TaxID=418103 RepID=A0A1D3JM03_PLAMA|nr:fam-l protein [Plasmodium malariae]KAI4840322.1 hypothetical protein MKS88_001040 [Plasmodium brasilianum]SBT87585.1 fam-l protein [Plasmodium malariae]